MAEVTCRICRTLLEHATGCPSREDELRRMGEQILVDLELSLEEPPC